MWKAAAFVSLFAALSGPAAAQCLAIPDGTGNTVLHCQDGRVGVEHTDPDGATSGMLGGQMLTAPLDPLSLNAVRPVTPSLATTQTPPISSPADTSVQAIRPFSTYPDPAGAGMRSQPGISPPARDSGATP